MISNRVDGQGTRGLPPRTSIGQILLVRKDEQECIPELVLVERDTGGHRNQGHNPALLDDRIGLSIMWTQMSFVAIGAAGPTRGQDGMNTGPCPERTT